MTVATASAALSRTLAPVKHFEVRAHYDPETLRALIRGGLTIMKCSRRVLELRAAK